MATNITQNTVPELWQSANDDVIYTFDFKQYEISLFTNSGGYLKLNVSPNFDVLPVVGEYIFIDNLAYFGTHKITTVNAINEIIVDTPYVAPTVAVSYVRHLRVPTFSLYKGFKGSEAYHSDLPYTLVSTIKPSIFYDSNALPYISLNIRGLVSRIFETGFTIENGAYDFSMFNAIRLEWDSTSTTLPSTAYSYVLNCAISTAELLLKQSTGLYLSPIGTPYIYSKGLTILTYMDNSAALPKIKIYINGSPL